MNEGKKFSPQATDPPQLSYPFYVKKVISKQHLPPRYREPRRRYAPAADQGHPHQGELHHNAVPVPLDHENPPKHGFETA